LAKQPENAALNAYSAWARAGLGDAMAEPGRSEALAQAFSAITHAHGDAEALAIAGWAAVHIARDFDAGLRAVELATALNPLSRIAWSASAWVRAMAGEDELALQHWDNAERCNPLESNIETTHTGRAICHWAAGRYEAAAAAAKRGLERQPAHPAGHLAAVAAAAQLGDEIRLATAIAAMLRFYPAAPDIPSMNSIPFRDMAITQRLLATVRAAAQQHRRHI
jgi:tetratricopeptide (TPR) repeat protein